MNDFTKDDLISIWRMFRHSDIQPFNSEEIIKKLEFKIKNYCEHELYLVGCSDSMIAQCAKCGFISRLVSKDE